MNSNNWMSLRPVALAVAVGLSLGLVATAQAGEDDTPLYLSAAHSISRDSNFSRDSNRQAETVNSTAVQVGIDKAYGRQTYRGSAKLTKSSYAHYGDLLNNDGKNVNGTVSSEFLRDWKVTVGGNYTENLNQIQDNNNNGNRVVRNIRKYRDGNLALQYGIGGLYNIVASYDSNKLNYSAPSYQNNNANQHGSGLRAVYNSTDLLNFGLGYRLVRTRYPLSQTPYTVTDRNVDFSTNWQVTGLSNLGATLTRRNSTYSSDPDRTVRGWTGALDWTYQPTGLVVYSVGLTRQTGSDRFTNPNQFTVQNANVSALNANNNVTTGLNLSANMKVTGKTTLTAGYNLTRYSVDNTVTLLNAPSGYYYTPNSSSSVAHMTTLGANYAFTRAVKLGCSYQKYNQTEGANRIGYDGHSVDCSASLTID